MGDKIVLSLVASFLGLCDLAAAKLIPGVGLDALAVHFNGLHAKDVPAVIPLSEDEPAAKCAACFAVAA